MAKRSINVEVSPRNKNESFEKMVRRFIKKVKKQKIIENYRERSYYKKPSTRRREEAIKRKKLLEKLRVERENRANKTS